MLTSLRRWLPALIMMAVIFAFSAQPSDNLPNFDLLDKAIKKGGHMIGYGLLGLAYFHALRSNKPRYLLAWLLAVLYAVTDEFHQSFVSNRSPSILDVALFDNLGAIIALGLHRVITGSGPAAPRVD